MKKRESVTERLAAQFKGLYLTALFFKGMVGISLRKTDELTGSRPTLHPRPIVKNALGIPEGYLDPDQVIPSFTDEELYRWVGDSEI